MKEFGWVQDSDMASVYVHLSGRDVDRAILKLYGMEMDKEDNGELPKPKKCLRCGETNPEPRRCFFLLDERAEKLFEREMNYLTKILREIAYIKDYLSAISDLQPSVEVQKLKSTWKRRGYKHSPGGIRTPVTGSKGR